MFDGKILNIIFASSETKDGKLVIGKNNDLPGWQGLIPSDMARFMRLTSYHTVIPGRKTWDSLDAKFKPLKNRQNIILTRDPKFTVEPTLAIPNTEVVIAHSLEEAMQLSKSEVVWIIGGAEIYALAIPYTDYIHWTKVHGEFEGDTFFPTSDVKGKKFDLLRWKKIDEEQYRAGVSGTEKMKDEFDSTYLVLKRI